MYFLIDPCLLVPEQDDEQRMRRFWSQLVDWEADGRVRVGAATHAYAYDHYASFGYPHNSLEIQPAALRPSFLRALNSILSRVSPGHPAEECRSFAPAYPGRASAGAALGEDVGSNAEAVVAIATTQATWGNGEQRVMCEPPPPGLLELCYAPHGETRAEAHRGAREFYARRRVHVVGGQVESAILKRLQEQFELADRVHWIPSEKNKPPSGLDKRWGGLAGDRDVTVCITGRIGHAASEKAARVSRSRGVTHIEVQSATGIVAALHEHAREAGQVAPKSA